jgi:hypothetical protein
MMKTTMRIIVTLAVLLMFAQPGYSEPVTFFGEDGNGNPLSEFYQIPPEAREISYQKSVDFLSNLVGVETEDFEEIDDDGSRPLPISFGEVTALLSGAGSVIDLVPPIISGFDPPVDTDGSGRYPISGSKYWYSGDAFSIEFSAEISAFGFFGVDVGDFSGVLTLIPYLGEDPVYDAPFIIEHSSGNAARGNIIYFGYYDPDYENRFDRIVFGTLDGSNNIDFFAFDDFTIGTLDQIQETPDPVPEPGTLLLFGPAAITFVGFRKRFGIGLQKGA